MFVTVGHGKKKKRGDELFFSGPLDPNSAGLTSHYQVTQKISKKKTAAVAVVSATFSATNNSVTLVLNNAKPGKPLMVTVSGLRGPGGEPVASFVTDL
jgi:hypothetical protein